MGRPFTPPEAFRWSAANWAALRRMCPDAASGPERCARKSKLCSFRTVYLDSVILTKSPKNSAMIKSSSNPLRRVFFRKSAVRGRFAITRPIFCRKPLRASRRVSATPSSAQVSRSLRMDSVAHDASAFEKPRLSRSAASVFSPRDAKSSEDGMTPSLNTALSANDSRNISLRASPQRSSSSCPRRSGSSSREPPYIFISSRAIPTGLSSMRRSFRCDAASTQYRDGL